LPSTHSRLTYFVNLAKTAMLTKAYVVDFVSLRSGLKNAG